LARPLNPSVLALPQRAVRAAVTPSQEQAMAVAEADAAEAVADAVEQAAVADAAEQVAVAAAVPCSVEPIRTSRTT